MPPPFHSWLPLLFAPTFMPPPSQLLAMPLVHIHPTLDNDHNRIAPLPWPSRSNLHCNTPFFLHRILSPCSSPYYYCNSLGHLALPPHLHINTSDYTHLKPRHCCIDLPNRASPHPTSPHHDRSHPS